jgi:hypothetical protein
MKERIESISMEKQENSENDRNNDYFPRRKEEECMYPIERVKEGKSSLHIVDTVRNNRAKQIARAYEKQEKGEVLSEINRIQHGEQPITTATKVAQGHRNDHILTSEQRAEMATLQRVRAAERFIYRTKGSSLSLI